MRIALGGRYGTGHGPWADVIVGMSELAAALAIDGRVVGLDLTGNDFGARADTEGGASVTYISSGAYDGSGVVRLRPHTIASSGGPNETYCGVLNGASINGGTKDVAQVNLGFCKWLASRYIDLGADSKTTGFLMSQTVGGAATKRAAVFDGKYGTPTKRIYAVTATTVQSWHQPISGVHPDEGPDADKLIFGYTSAAHGNNPPQTGQECLYFEQELDVRQDRGNPNGRNRLDVWARDGYLGFLEIPLTHDATWDFSYRYIRVCEYLGGLFNLPSTAHSDMYVDLSHLRLSVNRPKDARMGPPRGYLQAA